MGDGPSESCSRSSASNRGAYLSLALAASLVLIGCAPTPSERVDRLFAAEREEALDLALLEEAVHDESATVRATAAAMAGRLRDPRALGLLSRAAADPDDGVRATAAAALGEIQNPDAFEILAELVGDGARLVRLKAVISLGEMGDPRAGPVLLEAMEEEVDHDTREAIARSLAQVRSPETLEGLIGLLEDDSVIVRGWAARGLGDIGDPAAVPALEKLATSESSFDQGAALQALRALGERE